MYYLVGDIHGCYDKLRKLYDIIGYRITDEDILVFLGDYIDRGEDSYEVIEFLKVLENAHNTVFLKGNHEDMFLSYLMGKDTGGLYLYNGGRNTLRNYHERHGDITLPEKHREFFNSLRDYYESESFIAVHAGLRPGIVDVKEQSQYDLLWIRDKFFMASWSWPKRVVFGHTPTMYIPGGSWGEVYNDEERNIIGIDTGAVYGGRLTCLRLPDRVVYQV